MRRLTLDALPGLPTDVARPAFDPARLECGMVHLGVGAFHRAHQGVFTDAAIAAGGGDWGVTGVSLRRPDAAQALAPQDGLYTVTRLEAGEGAAPIQVVGSLRRVLTGPLQAQAVLEALASPATHVVTLTVTEPAYPLDAAGELDITHPDVAHDLAASAVEAPRSVAGWLAAGLSRRRSQGGGPLTVISCDNLRDNGRKLQRAVAAFVERREPGLFPWIEGEVAFPNAMVDCITPAADADFRRAVGARLGCEDHAAVRREGFAQWVIEERFAGPRPAWGLAGVEFVASVSAHEALKLHVLNAAHSALAYLGPRRGHSLVREAVTDGYLAAELDAMMTQEVAVALPQLPVMAYWATARVRFANPCIDHRLAQIAQDGAAKLRERVHPLIVTLARAGDPAPRLAAVVRAQLAMDGLPTAAALDDANRFDAPFRDEAAVRAAVIDSVASELAP